MATCPLMSYTNQRAECLSAQCALWRARDGHEGQCGLLSVSDRVTDGFDQLNSLIREIKAKL